MYQLQNRPDNLASTDSARSDPTLENPLVWSSIHCKTNKIMLKRIRMPLQT